MLALKTSAVYFSTGRPALFLYLRLLIGTCTKRGRAER